jgi:hypothetical protein
MYNITLQLTAKNHTLGVNWACSLSDCGFYNNSVFINVLKLNAIFDCNRNSEWRIRTYGFAFFIVPKPAFLEPAV